MIALDTNVVVRYLVQDDAAQCELADELFDQLDPQNPGFVPLVVVAEIAWVLGRSYRLPPEAVHRHLEELLASDDLDFEDAETVWRALLRAKGGADFADALIADTADLVGCEEIVTFDRRAAEHAGMRLLS